MQAVREEKTRPPAPARRSPPRVLLRFVAGLLLGGRRPASPVSLLVAVPPLPRGSSGRSPAPPCLLRRRGWSACARPAPSSLSVLSVGSPDVAPLPPRSLPPMPQRRPLPLRAGGRRYRSWRRLSRPASAPGSRRGPRFLGAPLRALCAAHRRVGALVPHAQSAQGSLGALRPACFA